MSELIKRLKEERIQGSSAVLNYSNFDYWVNWDDIVEIVEDHDQLQLNKNQQKWINRLTINYSWYGGTAQHALHATLQEPEIPDLPQNEFAQVLEVFSRWVQEQEEAEC
ncbi:hypothetical protein ACQUFG_13990 [Enterococcus gallinarum]|uniref:hypothetical protein n=1 Tax=Enterococcus gallinarum TaxID=1353 RepID=UPI003D13BF20